MSKKEKLGCLYEYFPFVRGFYALTDRVDDISVEQSTFVLLVGNNMLGF
jgi:hypothetical protein